MSYLYHYTSQPGLLGIFQSKSIWATNAHFLNDPTEFFHALSFARSAANYFFDSDYSESFGRMLYQHLKTIRGNEIYVASFSEKPDLLSQWRGYCPGGNGYCLGFDKSSLQRFCDERGYRLEKCVYGHDDQNLEVTGIIASAMALFPSQPITFDAFQALTTKKKVDAMVEFNLFLEGPGAPAAKEALDLIGQSLLELAPRFKNAGFHEEAEWRIIVEKPNPGDVLFRPGSSFVIPHLKLDLLDYAPEAFIALVVGPNPNADRAMRAAELLVASKGYPTQSVSRSSIPFNNW